MDQLATPGSEFLKTHVKIALKENINVMKTPT